MRTLRSVGAPRAGNQFGNIRDIHPFCPDNAGAAAAGVEFFPKRVGKARRQLFQHEDVLKRLG